MGWGVGARLIMRFACGTLIPVTGLIAWLRQNTTPSHSQAAAVRAVQMPRLIGLYQLLCMRVGAVDGKVWYSPVVMARSLLKEPQEESIVEFPVLGQRDEPNLRSISV